MQAKAWIASLAFLCSEGFAVNSLKEVFKLEAQGFTRVQQELKERYRQLTLVDPSSLQLEINRLGSTFQVQATDLYANLQEGDHAYVPSAWVRPLQSVISYYGVALNLYLKADENFVYPEKKFHEGKAIASFDGAKEAVLGPDGNIYLLDGHHTFTGSLLAEALTFPVKITKSYKDSGLTHEEFISTLIKNNQVFLIDLQSGERSQLKTDFSELEDSPLRNWVDESGAEIPATNSSSRVVRSETATPAWIRDANALVPFAEFKVARILVEEGLNEKTCPECFKQSASLSETVNETIRKYMSLAEAKGRFANLPGVYVLSTKQKLDSIDFGSLIPEFKGTYRVHIYHPPQFDL